MSILRKPESKSEIDRSPFEVDTKGEVLIFRALWHEKLLCLPANPNGKPNTDVLKPWINGLDVTRRPAGKWIIDFGHEMSEAEAALYEAPFAYVQKQVRPKRSINRRADLRKSWVAT